MAKHLIIRGVVQGVGFRYHMARQAARLGATGWVRNRSDGSVEALVDGDPEAVAALIAWAQRGPKTAEVIAVAVSSREPAETFVKFEQRPTL